MNHYADRLAALAGAGPVGSTMATNFRGETFAEARQQLVNVLKTQKSWLTDYAETYVDEFAAMATPHAPAKAREDGPIAYTPAPGFHFEHGDGVLRHVADGGDK